MDSHDQQFSCCPCPRRWRHDPSRTRAGGPRSDRPLRRSFTPAQKLEHLAAYEAACADQPGRRLPALGGVVLLADHRVAQAPRRRLLAGKQPGERVGKPSAEQAEIARLRRELDRAERRLATTETALEIMGKAHALLEQISESADTERPRKR